MKLLETFILNIRTVIVGSTLNVMVDFESNAVEPGAVSRDTDI